MRKGAVICEVLHNGVPGNRPAMSPKETGGRKEGNDRLVVAA